MGNNNINPAYFEIQPVSEPTSEQDNTIMLDKYTKYEGEYTKYEGERYSVTNEKLSSYKMVIGTDRSLYGLLKKNTDIFPNGPTLIDSRDDGVKIHNRNFNQSPKYVYSYFGGNGELLSCSFSTKRKSKTVQAEQSSTIDPLTKVVHTSVSQSCGDTEEDIKSKDAVTRNLWSTLNPDTTNYEEERKNQIIRSAKDEKSTQEELNSTYQVTKSDIEKFIEESKSQFKSLYEDAKTTGDISPLLKANSLKKSVVKVKKYIRTTVNPADYSQLRDPKVNVDTSIPGYSQQDVSGYSSRWISGMNYLKNNSNIIFLGYANQANIPKDQLIGVHSFPMANVIMEKEVEVELDGARILSSPLTNELQSSLSLNNLSDKTQKVVEGEIKVIGRPGLISSIIVSLNNVSKTYSGDWYVTDVKHTISSSGYVCVAKIIKKGIPVVLSTINSSIDTKSIYSELHKVAKESMDSVKVTDAMIKQAFVEYIKSDPSLANKSLVLDLTKSDPNTGSFSIYPASDDQVNINKEREKYKK